MMIRAARSSGRSCWRRCLARGRAPHRPEPAGGPHPRHGRPGLLVNGEAVASPSARRTRSRTSTTPTTSTTRCGSSAWRLAASWQPAAPDRVRRRGAHRGSRSGRAPTRPTSASAPGSTRRSISRPDGFRRRSASSAGAPTPPTTPSSAIRWRINTSTSIHPDAVPATGRRSGPHARARLALGLPGGRHRTAARRAAGHARSGGTPVSRRTGRTGIARTAVGRSPRARSRIRRPGDNNGAPQISGRRRRATRHRPDPRCVGGARRVAVERRRARSCAGDIRGALRADRRRRRRGVLARSLAAPQRD